MQGIDALCRNKAAGLDGITAELLQDGIEVLANPLRVLFSNILLEGRFPLKFSIGVIHPILKPGGEALNTLTYRLLTIGPVLGKLFASLLNERLTTWAETNKLRANSQSGFRKHRSTIDQCFVLRTIIEKCKHGRTPLYTCFVDFRKAFDSIPRARLWTVLAAMGLSGPFFDCLQAMYSQDTACVLTSDGLTSPFMCTAGVKQGCPLSPLLFGLYIDLLERKLLAIMTDAPKLHTLLVPILLFADDVILMATSLHGLQKQLDALSRFCLDYGLQVNLVKTKAMRFGSPSILRKAPSIDVMFDGTPIDVVSHFKYLGILFVESGAFKLAVETLRVSALRALHAMKTKCIVLGITDVRLQCRLFDTLVAPILLYGSEIWSVDVPPSEPLQNGFLKRLLGVCRSTPTDIVLAEFGKYPLKIRSLCSTIMYFYRLLSIEGNDILDATFHEQMLLLDRLPKSWMARFQRQIAPLIGIFPSTNLHDLLHLPTDAVINSKHQLKRSLGEHYVAQMLTQTNIKLVSYFQFNSCHEYTMQPHLAWTNRRLVRIMSQFRTGSHWLRIQTGRFIGLERSCRLCTRCQQGVVDNELHCLLACPAFDRLRCDFSIVTAGVSSVTGFFDINTDLQAVAKFLVQCRLLSVTPDIE